MERSLHQKPSADLDTPEAQQSLRIMITDAGSTVMRLHGLLRQALPLLENQESVPPSYRQKVAATIRAELECSEEEQEGFFDTDAIEESSGYEPGCLMDEEPW